MAEIFVFQVTFFCGNLNAQMSDPEGLEGRSLRWKVTRVCKLVVKYSTASMLFLSIQMKTVLMTSEQGYTLKTLFRDFSLQLTEEPGMSNWCDGCSRIRRPSCEVSSKKIAQGFHAKPLKSVG